MDLFNGLAAASRYRQAIVKYKVKILPSADGGFWAEAPGLPGCVTEGDTLEEIKPRVREAVAAWTGEDVSAADIELDIPVTNLSR